MSGFCCLGSVLPFRVVPGAPVAAWGPPQLVVLHVSLEGALADKANELLRRDDLNVIAVSPAIPAAEGNQYGERWPSFVLTVVYQERLLPSGPEEGDE